jgi:hypothetical protein
MGGVLIDGRGPGLMGTNKAPTIREARGAEWSYVAVDLTFAYSDRVDEFTREILFVAPDLFVMHDRVVAKEPIDMQLLIQTPDEARIDPVWGDVRYDTDKAALRIHAPAGRKSVHSWKRVEVEGDFGLPGTATMQLCTPGKLSRVDLITVFAVYPQGGNADYAFRLLESNTAIGARIHRHGLPTLVAFAISPTEQSSSLAGFRFQGPVGVDVFKPKRGGR